MRCDVFDDHVYSVKIYLLRTQDKDHQSRHENLLFTLKITYI